MHVHNIKSDIVIFFYVYFVQNALVNYNLAFMRNLKKLVKKKITDGFTEPLGNNLHKMFKVMIKLPLKHSSPPVILCKMIGSASASSAAKSTIYQVLQDSR